MKRHYDTSGHLSQVDLPGPGLTGTMSIYYGYDSTTGQMSSVTTASGSTGSWSNYDAVSGRAKNFSLGALSVSRTFDGLGRIASETSTANGISYAYDSYTYDGDGHCTSRNAPEGSWAYSYDSNGYISSASGVAGFTYSFDDAERTSSATTDYYPLGRTNSGTVRVFGSVNPSATLTINGTAATVNPTTGKYGVTYTPSGNTWQTYTVTGSLAGAGMNGSAALATETRSVYVPPTNETLGYDGDRNRSGDSRWTLGWDDMDRLTTITETYPQSEATQRETDCIYDLQGRCVQKTVKVGGGVTKVTTTLWDGWRVAMEVDKSPGGTILAQRYCTWGPDVSGNLNGKAGIGGLVELREIKGPAVAVSVPIYDGIGNLTGMADETSGKITAWFTYGPFGETVDASGPGAESCPFRFQTKPYDCNTGYSNFGRRIFGSTPPGWLGRDPIREDGGVNLYAYCNNDPVGNFDGTGLNPWIVGAQVINGVPQVQYADWAHWYDGIVTENTKTWWQNPSDAELARLFQNGPQGWELASESQRHDVFYQQFYASMPGAMHNAGDTVDAVMKIDGAAFAAASGAGILLDGPLTWGSGAAVFHEFYFAGANVHSLATGNNNPTSLEGLIVQAGGGSPDAVMAIDMASMVGSSMFVGKGSAIEMPGPKANPLNYRVATDAVYTGLPLRWKYVGPASPLQAGELTTYADADARSIVGDELEAHELWQHANVNEMGLATTRLSTPASQMNPVIILDSDTHADVTAAQEAFDARAMTPAQNIIINAQILRDLNAAPSGIIDAAEKASLNHAGDYGY